jgi:Tfp pilus assembly protein FimV
VGALGITSLRAWILAASLLAVSAVAHGAGLGKLNVTSALGEPLDAEIELFVEKKEISSPLRRRSVAPACFTRTHSTRPRSASKNARTVSPTCG